MAGATLDQIQLDNLIGFIEQEKVSGFLVKCLRTHHESTYWHSLRVAYLSLRLAKAYSLSGEELDVLFRSALLHDIGKLGIPVEVLDKEEKLTHEEWALIQAHPNKGVELVEKWIDDTAVDFDVILYHHENLDGSGYPFGKTETELSLSVRILRVVDSFDAITSARAYNNPMNLADAVKELYEHSGTCFDLFAVRKLHRLLTENVREIDAMTVLFNSMTGGTQA